LIIVLFGHTAVISLLFFAYRTGQTAQRCRETHHELPSTPQHVKVSLMASQTDVSQLDGVASPASEGFPAKRAAEIVGISYRQLDYWARTELVRPEFRASGSGSRRAYSYKNLLELRAVKNLLDAGIKLEKVRVAFDYLRDELSQDPTEVNLVISGTGSVLIRSGEQIIDLLREGQGVLNVLPLAGVKSEVDSKIVELYPEVSIESFATDEAAAN